MNIYQELAISVKNVLPQGLNLVAKAMTIVMLVFIPYSWGQGGQTGDAVLEEIVVTGVKVSLERSLDIKRNADNIMDVISAEAIGKFPDENVAESLQRITGVQISRSRGEGQYVTVRGLNPDFTRVQFNGRTLASAASESRSFDFTSLSSEFIDALEVSKTPTADMEEGGVAATVNLRTIRPLDLGERKLVGSGLGVHEDKAGETNAKFSVLYSDTFKDDTFGLAIGLSKGERDVNTHEYEAFGLEVVQAEDNAFAGPRVALDFNQDGDTTDELPDVFFNHAGGYGINRGARERTNGLLALQFRPTDRMDLWADVLYSKFVSELEAANNVLRFTNVNPAREGDPARLVKAEISNGLVTLFDADGVDHRNNNRRQDDEEDTLSIALGGNWDLTDRLTMEAEVSQSSSDRETSNLSLEVIGRASVVQEYGNLGDIPSIEFVRDYDPLDKNNFRATSLNGESGSTFEDDSADLRLDFNYELDAHFLTSVEFGVKNSNRERSKRVFQLNIGKEDLAGLLETPFDENVEGGSFNAAPYTKVVSVDDFLGGADGAGNFPSRFVVSDTRLLLNQVSLSEILGMFPGSLMEQEASNFIVEETVLAAYVKANFSGLDDRLTGNIGVRYVDTELDSSGFGADLNTLSFNTDGSVTTVGQTTRISKSRNYAEILPSLNLKYDITEDLVARLGIARTMSRPTLTQLSPASSSININVRRIAQGNPDLEPFLAEQLDLSLSWYFGNGGLLFANYFYKDLENIVSNGELAPVTVMVDLVGVGEREYTLTRTAPVNGDSQSIDGIELSYQQSFTFLPAPFDGLGIIANYTYIDASEDLESVSETSYNLTGYYENSRFSVRLAYNFREKYIGDQAINYFGDGVLVEDFAQLDLSVNVIITDHFSLTFEALNITEEPLNTVTGAGIVRGVEDAGFRYTFGVRASL